jgi:di/tricarboxylate transporter
MTFDIGMTAVVVLGILVALVREWAAPALVISGGMILLLLSGVLSPSEALAGFSNPAPITIAALLIISRAIERTGALAPMMRMAMRPEGTERGNLFRLLGPAAGVSAFMNNTPIVAMLIGPVLTSANRNGFSPSRFLMPLNHAVLLGGTVTLIGTSSNLIVSGLMTESGMPAMGMFELTPVGLPIAILGVAILVFAAPRLLPARKGLRERFSDEFREFTMEMEVEANGPVHRRTVTDVGLRHLQGVFLAWVRRGDGLVSPVGPDEVLLAGDRLGFVGRVDRVMDLQATPGLRLAAHKHVRGLDEGEHQFVEVVLAPISPLIGQTLKTVDFRDRYQATVLALHRSGDRVSGKLGEILLAPGDTLLLLTDRNFVNRWRDRRDFLMVSALNGALPVSSGRVWIVMTAVLLMIAASALDLVPILQGALVVALTLVATRILTPNEARAAIDLDVLLMVAASYGIGKAIETSGLATLLAGWLVQPVFAFGKLAVLGGVVVATLAVTQLITNNAAAILVFPIAVAAARQIGSEPRTFALAVAIAASGSFLTPIGYQTNTMIYGPGGYRFSDYIRLGLPVTLLMAVGMVFLASVFWMY